MAVLERNTVQYNCCDPYMSHGGWVVFDLLSSGVRRCVDHPGFAQFVAGCALDHAAANQILTLCQAGLVIFTFERLLVPYTFADAPVHELSAAEGTSRKHAASDAIAPPQVLAVRLGTSGLVDELDQCDIADAVLLFGPVSKVGDATSYVPLASPDVIDLLVIDWHHEMNSNCRTSCHLALSMFVPVCKKTSRSFLKSTTSFRLTVHPTPGTCFSWRYAA